MKAKLAALLFEPTSSVGLTTLRRLIRFLWGLPIPHRFRKLALKLMASGSATTKSEPESSNVHKKSEISMPLSEASLQTLAFYLPQFHRIPENDKFWGAGFTEWKNVQRARPHFDPHRQPRIPSELGYYDLSEPADVFPKQVELAKGHGLDGFAFHYYWFDGKPIMDGPIEHWFQNKSLEFGFLINWANENWTRRWDGLENEVLLRQNHTPEDDLKFISHVSRFFEDPRYVRLNGRPVLMIYRPMLFPDPRETITRFRNWYREHTGGDLHITVGLSFEQINPYSIGADSAVEYPPNQIPLREVSSEKSDLAKNFKGRIHEFRDLAESAGQVVEGHGLRFKTVVPGWDNTPRKVLNATVYDQFEAKKFMEWTEKVVLGALTQEPKHIDKLVFINAWNEWAEGAFMEPDLENGRSKLVAFDSGSNRAKQLVRLEEKSASNFITVVTHDCNPNGAQQLALSMVRIFTQDFGMNVEVLALGGGPLENVFRESAHTFQLLDKESFPDLRAAASGLRGSAAVVNSAASYPILDHLSAVGINTVTLVHELETYLRPIHEQGGTDSIVRNSLRVVFPHEVVSQRFNNFSEVPTNKKQILHQGAYRRVSPPTLESKNRAREALEIDPADKVILASGYGDLRKGFDLFLAVAEDVVAMDPAHLFVWVGGVENIRLLSRLSKLGQRRVRVLGHRDDPTEAYLAADAFVLTSRDDPFPSVVMEAIQSELPVYGFDCGGSTDLIRESGGYVCEVGDVKSLAMAILEETADHHFATQAVSTPELLEIANYTKFSMRRYAGKILDLLGAKYPKVSVVVPVYNQASWIRETLDSIANQVIPVLELLIFDDCSNDGSVHQILDFAHHSQIPVRIFTSRENTGSPAWSWTHATEIATGDFIWIVEGDDVAEKDFLSSVMPLFESHEVVFSASASSIINEFGEINVFGNADFLSDTVFGYAAQSFVLDSKAALEGGYAFKNPILNVASVVFREEVLQLALERCWEDLKTLKKSQDWRLYIEMLTLGRIAYHPSPKIRHRRHPSSVIGASKSEELRDEALIIFEKSQLFDDLDIKTINERREDFLRLLEQRS